MFYKTSFLMRDSRSKKKKWDTGTGFKGQFYFERSFFSIKKSLKASRKYHKISLSEPSGDSKKWVPSILVSWHAWCCFSNFLKTFIRRTDLYVESFNLFIITAFLFLIGNTNCWFILFNMDKFQVDLMLVVDVAHLGVINASIWYCNTSWYALIIIRDNLR